MSMDRGETWTLNTWAEGRGGRAVRLTGEYLGPQQRFAEEGVHDFVVCFGSARTSNDDPSYLAARDISEKITGNVEIREIFSISKIGNIAGCMVKDGIVSRNSQIRLLRDNVVIHTGALASLKRFKEEVKEVKSGFECGVMLENYSDIKIGDIIETFEEIKTERKL